MCDRQRQGYKNIWGERERERTKFKISCNLYTERRHQRERERSYARCTSHYIRSIANVCEISRYHPRIMPLTRDLVIESIIQKIMFRFCVHSPIKYIVFHGPAVRVAAVARRLSAAVDLRPVGQERRMVEQKPNLIIEQRFMIRALIWGDLDNLF